MQWLVGEVMSKIEWTEQTWNPVVGCTKVSPGCKHCYAEKMHARLRAMGSADYQEPFTKVKTLEHQLSKPLGRKKPTIYFVNSMSDLFHEKLMAAESFIYRVIGVMPSATSAALMIQIIYGLAYPWKTKSMDCHV